MRHVLSPSLLLAVLLAVPDHGYAQNADLSHQHSSDATAGSAETKQHQHQSATAHADHGQEETVDPSENEQDNSEAMPIDHSTMMQSEMAMDATDERAPRDPHAYSNGYELATGPYTLETESMMGLADETIFTGLWVDRLEYVESHDTDATEFEGHAWIGDSYNRFLLRTEIEIINDSLDTAELDLLHRRAISPFWNIQFGARREFRQQVNRNWVTVGLTGLAPYWFEVDASLFLGENGNSLLDIEAEYDLLLTQRLVMQPRLDIHSYGKTDEKAGHGAGLSLLKAGFRVRYEFDRQFAPYLGVERVVRYGKTADLLPSGQDRNDTHWIAGFKFWF